jgi:hypothetical protein
MGSRRGVGGRLHPFGFFVGLPAEFSVDSDRDPLNLSRSPLPSILTRGGFSR